MSLNIPLIDQVLEQIDGHPETWDQEHYANECGTAFCVAGWVAVMGGYTYADQGWPRRWIAPDGTAVVSETVAIYARNALGLTRDQAWALFEGSNTRAVIENVLDAIRDGAL